MPLQLRPLPGCSGGGPTMEKAGREQRELITPWPPTGAGDQGGRGCPHATAPSPSIQSKGSKEDHPLEIQHQPRHGGKGQWTGPRPSEGGRLSESTDGPRLRHPSRPGLGCSLSTRSGERGGGGMTPPRRALSLGPPGPQHKLSSPH